MICYAIFHNSSVYFKYRLTNAMITEGGEVDGLYHLNLEDRKLVAKVNYVKKASLEC